MDVRIETMDESNNFGWFLAGAVIGAGAAILFAPKSGKETREYLAESTRGSKEAMESSGRDLMDRGKALYDQGKKIVDDAGDLFERGRKLVQG
jgi:gas vesicle protein